MQDSKTIKETLDGLFDESDSVFLVVHKSPDMDAIASCLGMSLICRKKGKENYIVIEEDFNSLEDDVTKKAVKRMANYEEKNKKVFNIIKPSEVPKLVTKKSLLMCLDVNMDHRTLVKPYLDSFKNVIIIDHHNTDESTIKTKNIFVDDKLSSVSEEVSRLCSLYKIKLNPDYANYLLAGIALDTRKFQSNYSEKTRDAEGFLTKNGANRDEVLRMFAESFESFKRMQNLIQTVELYYGHAIACSDEVYGSVEIAKVADTISESDVLSTFVIANKGNNLVGISARSSGIIDVSKIMRLFGGNGSSTRAAAVVEGKSAEEVKSRLKFILIPTNLFDVDKSGDVKLLLTK